MRIMNTAEDRITMNRFGNTVVLTDGSGNYVTLNRSGIAVTNGTGHETCRLDPVRAGAIITRELHNDGGFFTTGQDLFTPGTRTAFDAPSGFIPNLCQTARASEPARGQRR